MTDQLPSLFDSKGIFTPLDDATLATLDGRTDYRMELRAIKTAPPMTIDDDDSGDDGEADPRYLPDVRGRRIGSEREDEGADE